MNALFSAFGRASLFGLAALVVALGAQLVLDGRVPASWRVWIWRVALLQTALALIPPVTLRLTVLPPRHLVAAPARRTFTAPLPIRREIRVASTPPSVAMSQEIAPLRASAASARTARLNWRWAFAAIYTLGLGIRLAILANCFARVRRLLHDCNAVEETAASESLREIARLMRVSPLPRLLDSETSAPCLVGIRRPAIVLPRSLLTPQNPDLAAVLSHELAHLKRRDLNWNAVLWPIQTLFWFHPLVWCTRWFLALETESACDEITLSSTRVAPQSYGALILNTMSNPTTPLTAGITDGFFTLKKRLARLSQAPKRPRRALRVAFVGALCIALGASLPLRLVARAQNQPESAVTAKSGSQPTNPYKITRRIPRDDTPEAQVGLPARLEDARGNSTVTGRVVYENGTPAAGLRVSIGCRWLSQTELWGYHRNAANHYRWPDKIDKLLSGITRTRADGTYRFTGLLPQRYGVRISGFPMGNRAPEGFLAPYYGVRVTAIAKQTRRAPDTVLRPSARIRIRVLDAETGAPLEGVVWRGFNLDEGQNPTGFGVEAHQKMRPMKGFPSEAATDKNGDCTLSLDRGKAYFFMGGGNYMGSTARDAPVAHFKGLPDSFMTSQGRYKSAAWCEVKALAPTSEAKKAARRAWKGETEFQLQRGPAANFVVKLKRIRALRPDEQELLAMMKRRF